MARQIKSRERTVQHGEVFTNEREVNAMLDLVAQECDRPTLDARFLEPACGNGNFLAEIVRRKLNICLQKHKKSTYDFERFSILAMSSIYGVDILQDNVIECRKRLYEIWEKEYCNICKSNKEKCNEKTKDTIKYIFEKNILCGNALTMMTVDENQQDTEVPIIFPEWSLIMGTKIKRRDFRFDVLIKANSKPSEDKQKTLFEDDLSEYLYIHPATGEYEPKPIKEYSPVHYHRIVEVI